MPSKLILFGNSYDPGESYGDLPEQVALERMDEDTVSATSCPSLNDLGAALDSAREQFAGGKLRTLEIVAHGSNGVVYLGAEQLDRKTLVRFRHRGFDDFMADGGRVEIIGCSCAEGPIGELFMAELAPILLAKRGGGLVGHTAAVKVVPVVQWTFDFGTNVTAVVSTGGGVTLRAASHLLPDELRRRLRESRSRVADASDRLPIYTKATLARRVAEAGVALGPDTTAPNFRRLFDACKALDEIDATLPPPKPAPPWAGRML